MAKQRRNRERATELMTSLDELVPAVYPYRAFTSTDGVESSLRKRSRNKTLEDVIAAVIKVKAHQEQEVWHFPFFLFAQHTRQGRAKKRHSANVAVAACAKIPLLVCRADNLAFDSLTCSTAGNPTCVPF